MEERVREAREEVEQSKRESDRKTQELETSKNQ